MIRHVVRFRLSAPDADFPIVLSDTRTQISRNGYEDFVSTTVGTGPFKVKDWKSGSRYVFERNDTTGDRTGPGWTRSKWSASATSPHG